MTQELKDWLTKHVGEKYATLLLTDRRMQDYYINSCPEQLHDELKAYIESL
jgi:hypothetical protein